jgi:Na+/H+ antiporter NhaA
MSLLLGSLDYHHDGLELMPLVKIAVVLGSEISGVTGCLF